MIYRNNSLNTTKAAFCPLTKNVTLERTAEIFSPQKIFDPREEKSDQQETYSTTREQFCHKKLNHDPQEKIFDTQEKVFDL